MGERENNKEEKKFYNRVVFGRNFFMVFGRFLILILSLHVEREIGDLK